MALGAKRALDILLCLWKKQSSDADLEFSPYVVIRGNVTSPSLLCPRMSYDCCTLPFRSVPLLVLWRITCQVLWRLWYFHNETRSGGYLSHGWEGIGVNELWLCHPEVHEPRNEGEKDCYQRLSLGRQEPNCPPPAAGSGAPAGDNRKPNPNNPFSSMSRFMYFREV